MTGKIQFLSADINDLALDNRGAIYSFIPHNSIVEFCYIDTKQGTQRGHHYHEEFDEYIMLVQGEGIYLERLNDGSNRKIVMGAGQCIYIPAFTPHTFVPLTDCKSVSLLTKRWNDATKPITKLQ
jgi:mannose-6-phosphate isomerase-like protein (cupin superfamily)